MFVTVFLMTVLTAIFVAKMPLNYRSSAVFQINQPSVTRSTDNSAFNSYADRRVQEVSEYIMSHAKLINIVNKYTLYNKNSEPKQSNDKLVQRIRGDIEIKRVSVELIENSLGGSTQKPITLRMSYKNKKPKLAQSVTDELALLILNENLSIRMKLGDETPDFLSSEISRFEKLMSNLQSELAQYKQENVESHTELIKLNQKLKESTKRNMDEIKDRINGLIEQKIYISTKLSEIGQQDNLSFVSEEAGGNLNIAQRLKNLQIKADILLSQNGETYPELKLMRKEISVLSKKMGKVDKTIELEIQLDTDRGELANYQQRYDDGHPDIIRLKQKIISIETAINKSRVEKKLEANKDVSSTSNNLEYTELKDQLLEANLEIDSLVSTKAGYSAKLIAIERSITQLSQSEQRAIEISIEYQNALKIYQELKEKQKQQNLSGLVVEENKGEKIILLEPPQLPTTPVQPNRTVLLMIGTLLSVISGMLAVFIRERFDDSVKGSDDLMQILGLETLGEISYIKVGPETS